MSEARDIFQKANQYLRQGGYEEAENHYRKYLDINPEVSEAHNGLGSALKKQERYEEAKDHYQKALDIDPQNKKAHYNLGGLLGKQERYEEAENHYRKALDIDPQYKKVHYNFGGLLGKQGRYGEAEDHYRKALDIDPQYKQAHRSLGFLLTKKERYEEAEDHYRKALDIDPQYKKAHNSLGILLRERERYEEAEDHFRQALDIDPRYANAHDSLGLLLKEQERYEGAEDHFRQALDIDPQLSEAYTNLGELLEEKGDVLRERAEKWLENNEPDRALKLFDKAQIAYEDAREMAHESTRLDTNKIEEKLSEIESEQEAPPLHFQETDKLLRTGVENAMTLAEIITPRLRTNPIPDELPCVPNVSVDYSSLTNKEPIGSGGNADVTKATLPTPDEEVTLAIKEPRISGTLHTEQIERVLAEAETWDKLDDHDHIVGVVDYGSEPLPWIAMEYMDAGHLGERSGELDIAQALWTAIAVTKGVRHAHRQGVAHLDLKSENVLFRSVEDAWDVPKVADWGLSKQLLEHSKSVEGLSPQYAAPEQFDEDFGSTDDITDIYQLGAVFYELFTGRLPFEGKPAKAMYKVLHEQPTPPSEIADVPDDLDGILLTALAKEKDDRYDNIVYLRDALQELFDEY